MVNKAVKHYAAFAEAMREQGCHVRPAHGGGGYFILLPNGKPTVLPGTPSNHRWVKNLKSDIKRAGLEYPEIGEKFG